MYNDSSRMCKSKITLLVIRFIPLKLTFFQTVSCLDPWVYAMNHPKYRLELEKRFPWMGIKEKMVVASDDASGAVSAVVNMKEEEQK
jgi:hypothetical protein